jgi:protein TonB
MARIAHIQGDVVLQATISKNGSIENLHAISGHPILIQAALDAVRQWKYKPYILNSEPVEVETQITVKFHM